MVASRPTDLINELLDHGMVDEEQLTHAQEYAKSEGVPLDQAIIDTGTVSEDDFLRFIANHYQIPLVDLEEVPFDEQLVSLVSERIARRYLALPLYKKGHNIVVAMAKPWNVSHVDDLRFSIGRSIWPVLAPRGQLHSKIDELFIKKSQTHENGKELTGESAYLQDTLTDLEDAGLVSQGNQQEQDQSTQQLLQESSASPIVKLVNDILMRSIQKGASDIHIQPQESNVIVRFRVDGALREVMSLPNKAQNAIISRIKVLSRMDISVSRKPQDGRIKVHYRDKPLDLRVSTLPTYWGEKVVLRILDQSGGGLEVEKLGFLRSEYDMLQNIMKQPQGMLLVTGPTGSGKTTTLYSILSAINQPDVNIITVEDPVEYQLAKISQVPVNPKAGMTFASGLRSILRQDPDVIMVGEIRDQETAEIALESAETGHMVFSTLHTNSAAGAVTRFLDMNVPSYLLASSLSGVLAQRLLRRNCPDCMETVEIGEGLRTRFNIPTDVTFYEGKGCTTCDGQGTKGRLGVYELLVADREIADGIQQGINEAEMVDRARRGGMHLMFEDGLIKAMQGKVPMTEVLRGLETPGKGEIDANLLWAEAELTWEKRDTANQITEASEEGEDGSGAALVVSGERGYTRMIAALLESEGLTAEVTDSGRKALGIIRQRHPGLVVADMDCPDLDGVALAKSLRQETGVARTPLVLLAEKDNARSESRALDAGADDFLPKPLDPDRLLARIRRLRALYARLAVPATAAGKDGQAADADGADGMAMGEADGESETYGAPSGKAKGGKGSRGRGEATGNQT